MNIALLGENKWFSNWILINLLNFYKHNLHIHTLQHFSYQIQKFLKKLINFFAFKTAIEKNQKIQMLMRLKDIRTALKSCATTMVVIKLTTGNEESKHSKHMNY